MLPWMIDKLNKQQRKEESRRPLYLPLQENWLTGSIDRATPSKESERGSVEIDYSL